MSKWMDEQRAEYDAFEAEVAAKLKQYDRRVRWTRIIFGLIGLGAVVACAFLAAYR